MFANTDEALGYLNTHFSYGPAAGVTKQGDVAVRHAEAGSKLVKYGSITWLNRPGNDGDNFWCDPVTGDSINAWGIPNKGFDEHLEEIPSTRSRVNALGARFCVSISAGDRFVAQEYYDMAYGLSKKSAADLIEGNYSCGNMKVGTTYKPVVCYDIDAFDDGVAALRAGAGPAVETSAKLTPTTERRFLIANVESCLRHNIDYIVLANTIPNSYLEKEDGTPAITMVRGGLGGRGLIPIVTGMLQLVKPIVQGTHTKVIIAGGVEFGRDAYYYLKHGADGFEAATLYWKNNLDPRAGQNVIAGDPDKNEKGLLDLLVERGLPIL